MNMKSIFNFAVEVMNLFAAWLSFEDREWGWCLIPVDNRDDRF